MSTSAIEQLEQQKARLDQLNARRNRIQGQLEAARQQYAEAVAEAQSAYGTADLDKLRELLVQKEAENAAAIAEFIRAMDEFETIVSRIEKALADPEAMNALLVAMPAPAAAPAEPVAAAPASMVFSGEDI